MSIPLDRKTADQLIKAINDTVGKPGYKIVMCIADTIEETSQLGTNMETAEELYEFMRTFFNKEATRMMFENSRQAASTDPDRRLLR